jgi:hypothetical protein
LGINFTAAAGNLSMDWEVMGAQHKHLYSLSFHHLNLFMPLLKSSLSLTFQDISLSPSVNKHW